MSGDQRMHGGNTPGMVPGRGHERFEEEVRLDHPEPGAAEPVATKEEAEVDSTRDRHQESALGGHVATTSGTAETPADERD